MVQVSRILSSWICLLFGPESFSWRLARRKNKNSRITRNYRSHEFCRDDGFILARLSTTTVLSGLLILLLEWWFSWIENHDTNKIFHVFLSHLFWRRWWISSKSISTKFFRLSDFGVSAREGKPLVPNFKKYMQQNYLSNRVKKSYFRFNKKSI